MARLSFLLLGYATLIVANAAPSDRLENTPPAENNKEVVESLISVGETAKDTIPGQRQKRWYNYYGYGFPPLNPINYPTAAPFYNQQEEPFLEIYRKLKDISAFVKTPNQPAPPPQFPQGLPIFFPVIFIPQFGNCRCGSNNTPNQPSGNGTVPDLPPRWPDMDDTNQNWGIAVNESEEEDPIEYDRPISFDPIPPEYPTIRPPPPVEHGSTQADSNNASQTTTTTTQPPIPANPPSANSPSESPRDNTGSPPAPTPCDGAILSCCHQPQVTYNCFADQGCPDISAIAFNGSPCDPSSILTVVGKFQRFYGQRTG